MKGIDNETLKHDIEVLENLYEHLTEEEKNSLNHAIECMQSNIAYEKSYSPTMVLDFKLDHKEVENTMKRLIETEEIPKMVEQNKAYAFEFKVVDEIKANTFAYDILHPLMYSEPEAHDYLCDILGIEGYEIRDGGYNRNHIISQLENTIEELQECINNI